MVDENTSTKVKAILEILDRLYPDAKCSLDYGSPIELLVATILSAQCTDERVNVVTPELFRRYPSAAAFAAAPIEEIEAAIRSTGFYHNKARAIKAAAEIIDRKYGGRVPDEMDRLVELPGIGRKTANVVLGNAYGIPGLVVDTHVARVSARLGLTAQKDPEKIEQDLMLLVPCDRWIKLSHQFIQHGRRLCMARKPRCAICPLRPHCDFGQAHQGA